MQSFHNFFLNHILQDSQKLQTSAIYVTNIEIKNPKQHEEGISMLEKVLLFVFVAWLLFAKTQILYFFTAWLRAYFLKPTKLNYKIDLRRNVYKPGKTITFCAIKTDPRKSVWFGHVWIIWPKHKTKIRQIGFYPQCKKSAFLGLIVALLTPHSLLFGNKPTRSVINDDSELNPDWALSVRIDDEAFERALKMDENWQDQSNYQIFGGLFGQSINCRDYIFDIAQEVGLRVPKNTMWELPPISFASFVKLNTLAFDFGGCSFAKNRSVKALIPQIA